MLYNWLSAVISRWQIARSYRLFLFIFLLMYITGEFNQLYLSLYLSPKGKSSSAAFSRCIIISHQAVVVSDVCFLALNRSPYFSIFHNSFCSSCFGFWSNVFFLLLWRLFILALSKPVKIEGISWSWGLIVDLPKNSAASVISSWIL